MLAARRILVFHSDNDERRAIADALHTSNGTFAVIADTHSMDEAVVLSRFHKPDMIILGFQESPEMNDFVYVLRAAAPDARVVGYLSEDQEVANLVPGLHAIVTHKRKAPKLLEAFERAFGNA